MTTMAGHSHSANIKHRKNAVDAKRAKAFSKLARNVISAARQGGAEVDTNLKLKYAVEKAKAANMPKDNIERAIKKGSGEKGGADFEELIYEGYAPGGIALLICCLTDNRNRTAPDVKYTLEHGGGNLGSTGSVSFLFDFRSIMAVDMTGGADGTSFDEETLMDLGLEIGAEDVDVDGEMAMVLGPAVDFLALKEGLEAAGAALLSAEMGYIPQTSVAVQSKADAAKLIKLIDELEENDDVQNVYANYEMDDAWLADLHS
jgi:YebC/PmpR family DNA-binding regulatory protein